MTIPALPGSIVGLGPVLRQGPAVVDDRVEFDDDQLDSYGLPAMRIHYTLTDAGSRRARSGPRASSCVLAAAVGEPLGDAPVHLAAGSSLHYQGTTRMGETDDGRSVC